VIPHVLELVSSGTLHPELVTSAVMPWDDVDNALADLQAKSVIVR